MGYLMTAINAGKSRIFHGKIEKNKKIIFLNLFKPVCNFLYKFL